MAPKLDFSFALLACKPCMQHLPAILLCQDAQLGCWLSLNKQEAVVAGLSMSTSHKFRTGDIKKPNIAIQNI